MFIEWKIKLRNHSIVPLMWVFVGVLARSLAWVICCCTIAVVCTCWSTERCACGVWMVCVCVVKGVGTMFVRNVIYVAVLLQCTQFKFIVSAFSPIFFMISRHFPQVRGSNESECTKAYILAFPAFAFSRFPMNSKAYYHGTPTLAFRHTFSLVAAAIVGPFFGVASDVRKNRIGNVRTFCSAWAHIEELLVLVHGPNGNFIMPRRKHNTSARAWSVSVRTIILYTTTDYIAPSSLNAPANFTVGLLAQTCDQINSRASAWQGLSFFVYEHDLRMLVQQL